MTIFIGPPAERPEYTSASPGYVECGVPEVVSGGEHHDALIL
jgi:hypothetical protein